MVQGNIAIIGGTGFEQLPPEIFAEPVEVATRYGAVQVLSVSNNYTEPYKLYFLPRHGARHDLAPHQIDYRANNAALVALGVTGVLASNAVGSLCLDLDPGSLILFDDFIDYTRQRHLTVFDTGEPWRHVDFSQPYSETLRNAILRAATDMGQAIVPTGTYLCCDGPRFETPAEIRMFAAWGADVIGMTGIPEAVYARESGIEYAALGIVTNYGAGLTPEPVDHALVSTAMAAQLPTVRELLFTASGYVIDSGASRHIER
jgi:5'-methylthioadenosine phosphorylase